MSTRPTAHLVVIGNEVLSGKVIDRNTPFLLGRFRTLGVECVGVDIIPDELPRIARAVRTASEGADFVITTGGVGPTHDDLTMDGVAMAFGVPVVESPALRELIETRWTRSKGSARFRMARIPEGASLEGDPAFPTVCFRNVYILPGVPRLVVGRFGALQERFRGPEVHCQSVWTNQGESESADLVHGVVDAHPDVEIGSYPQWGREDVRVILTVEGIDVAAVQAATDALAGALDPARLVRIERTHRAEAVEALDPLA